ncbi:hypothetical protein EV379_1196 [Microterricola gilva]|uniref:Uncharacterized protein n=1 Tax=Microterricola gilva TaxID=393267 RepID=A0A4Q8ALW7_9MICO|nr:hypothetical protein [Microterricola gilva]RZU64885.1 hypothetical protein EV379_1196 [Microterricola gilva]
MSSHLVWPRSTDELVNRALCPACFQTLRGLRCTVCGLDLSSPLAAELLQASTDAAEQLNRRGLLIAQMRAAVPVAAPAPAPVPIAVPAATVVPPVAAPAEVSPAAVPPAATPPAAAPPAAAPRRSSVQMLLLVVGVSLVAVALVFFLIIAWFVAGLAARAIIVAAITVLVFGAVSLLQRFRLHSTAEGIAVLAVLLVYLDIWAIQANDLFGAASVDSARYWGIAVLLSAPLLLGWFRFTGMRAASVAGFAAVPVGAGLLAWAVATPPGQGVDAFQRPWLSAVVIVGAALVQLLAPRLGRSLARPHRLLAERVLVLLIASPAVPAAVILGLFVAPGQHWAPIWGLGVPTAVFAVHVLAGLRMPETLNRTAATVAAAAAGFSLAAMPIVIGLRASTETETLVWPVLVSVAVLLAVDAMRPRLFAAGLGAGIGAGAVVAAALVVVLCVLFVTFVARAPLANGFGPWRPADPATLQPDVVAVQAALVVVGAALLTAGAWSLLGVLRRRVIVLQTLVVLSALGCAVLIAPPAVAALAYLAIAACALAVLALPALNARIAPRAGSRALGFATLIVAASAGYLLAFDSLWLWLLGSGVIIGLLLGAREIAFASVLRPVLLAATVVFALVTTAMLPIATVTATGAAWSAVVDTRALVILVSGLLLLLFSVPLGRFAPPSDRAWALGSAAVVGVLASLTGALSGDGPLSAPLLAGIGVAAAGTAAVLLIALPANRALAVTRVFALFGVTPAFWLSGQYGFAALATAGVPAPRMLVELWPAVVGLLVLAISLAWELRSATARPNRALDRLLLDASAGLVLVIGVVGALAAVDGPAAWLVYLVAGIAVLLASVDRAGLFNAASPRHQLGWLALALGTAALWSGLSDAGVTAPEPYSVTLAAALLLIAVLLVRGARRDGAEAASASTAVSALVAAGILIALVPSAVYGANGSVLRPILTVAIAGVMLIGSCLWRAPLRATPLRNAVIGASAVALLVAVGARALGLLGVSSGTVSGIFELWVLSGAGILIAAAAALGGESRRLSTALVATALVGGTLLEIAALAATADAADGGLRAIPVIAALSAAHVLLSWLRPTSLAPWVPTLALGLAGATALYYLATFVLGVSDAPPFELATVPVALAWTASGAIRLSCTPGARSWPALGGGLALLLVPSLLADYTDSPLWRVVGLGVVGLAVLLAGLALRLQAPFVLGGGVVLLHGLAQLWPWLSSLYNPTLWWLWLGVGGILLIALAARYEKRIQNLKHAAARITALR